MSARERSVRSFLLPDLGEGLTDAEITAWLVDVGDTVVVDQPVAEVETAKAAVQVPCPFPGTVTELHGLPGEAVEVGAPLISVRTPAAEGGASAAAGGDREDAGSAAAHGSGAVLVGYGTRPENPSRRRPPRRDAVEEVPRTTASAEPPSRSGGAPAPRSWSAPHGRAPVISPLVRRIAREHGVDAAALDGSGEGGLVLRRDVEAAAGIGATTAAPEPATAAAGIGAAAAEPARAPASAVAEAAVPRARAGANGGAPARGQQVPLPAERARPTGERPTGAGDGGERVALSAPHRAMARQMARSRREIPEATVWVDADATGLLELRKTLNEADPERPVSLLALLARFCVLGLSRFPALNSRFDAEHEELLRPPGVGLGFAAQTPRGLVVPVVHGADTLTTRQLAAELASRTADARAGTLTPEGLRGGTFTVNNYGVFGVDGAAAVINHPESAIAGMGRIVDRPWAVDGQLTVRPVTELTLAFDHRVCDGAEAGAFLRFVADCVERPAVLLGDL